MKLTKQKKITKDFFNQVAHEWFERTYDPSGQYLKFPSNRVRAEIALGEIIKLKLRGKMLDIGCGTGQLVIELLKRKREVSGIDVAENVVEQARAHLRKLKLKADPEKVFKVSSLASLSQKNQYNLATALGLLEYLENDAELFRVLRKIIKKGGYALVECRNKLFNLFSANDYTSTISKKDELPQLVKQLNDIERYSPKSANKIPYIEAGVSQKINKFLALASKNKEWFSTKRKSFSKYPAKMIRQQHTPQELEKSAARFGFKLQYVVYGHAHPYPPYYEKKVPKIYNKIALLMSPLGQTSLGAWMGSSFVAVLKK